MRGYAERKPGTLGSRAFPFRFKPGYREDHSRILERHGVFQKRALTAFDFGRPVSRCRTALGLQYDDRVVSLRNLSISDFGSSSRRPMVRTPVIAMVSVSFGSVFMRRGYAASPAHDHGQAEVRRFGTRGSLANSPASARRIKSDSALSVRYGLPAMFTVVSQPLLRQRHAVTSEIPASSQNLCRLRMGLFSMLKFDIVFTTGNYEHRAG